jgi:hypothetical protein
MKSTEFVIEGTFEGADGRGYVVARVLGSAAFDVGPDAVLGGCPVEQWLEIPRTLDEAGRQRTDLFGFCFKDTADRLRLKVGERVVLE